MCGRQCVRLWLEANRRILVEREDLPLQVFAIRLPAFDGREVLILFIEPEALDGRQACPELSVRTTRSLPPGVVMCIFGGASTTASVT